VAQEIIMRKSDLTFAREALQAVRRPHVAATLGLPAFSGYSWEIEAKADVFILRMLAIQGHHVDERINERAALAARIAACAEDGKILVEESGRDCDCVEYSGRTRLIDANVQAFYKLWNDIGNWSDGPFRLEVYKPSEGEIINYKARDLVMEAHENGHPHSIVSRFP
jgi:hypothetical protein